MLITVCVISYNQEKTILETLESIKYQLVSVCPCFAISFFIWGLGFEKLPERAENVKVKGYFLFVALVTVWTVGLNLSHVLGFFLRYFPGFIILFFTRYKFRFLP